jgi:microcystin-dependent protein
MSGIISQQNEVDGSGKVSKSVSAPNFVGMIQPFGMASPPAGWLLCDGSAILRSTYVVLFGVIGTTWGAGDSSTTFNVPRLQGAFLRGAGTHGTSQMGNTNAFAGGSVGAVSNDQHQDFRLHNQSGLTKIGGPQYQGGFSGRTIGNHGMAFRSGDFYYDHTQGGNSPYSGQFSYHAGITNAGGTTTTSGGDIRVGGETKPFSAAVEYMIFSGVGV